MKSFFEYTDKLNSPYDCFLEPVSYFQGVKKHWHYFMEIIYVFKGQILVTSGDKSFVASEGDLVLFLPTVLHSISMVSEDPLQYGVLKFDPGHLGSSVNPAFPSTWNYTALFRHALHEKSARTFFSSEQIEPLATGELFLECIREQQDKKYGYQTILQCDIRKLITGVLRIWRDNGFDTDQFFNVSSENSTIYNITEYIDIHATEALRVEDIADLCSMSYSYFAKSFKELYGLSCKKYIEFIRLCKVEDLLKSTDFDLSFISQETGFADCSHLIRAFKEKNDCTPHQFRRSS